LIKVFEYKLTQVDKNYDQKGQRKNMMGKQPGNLEAAYPADFWMY
jgi:hypothetical protein